MGKVVTIEEEKNNLEYKETMNLDKENFLVQVNQFGDQYMKLLMIHILKMRLFPTDVLDHCKKRKQTSNLTTLKSKILFFIDL